MSTDLERCTGANYGAQPQKNNQSYHIGEYRKNEAKNVYAQLLVDVMLGDGTFKKVLEYLHGDRKNMEEVSYENRNCSTIVPEDVAAGAGMSKRSAKRILSMLSSRDFPVLKREGYDTYHLTEIGSKCLSNMSYRNNLEKLSKMPGMKMDAETDL